VDLGGTNIETALVDTKGCILASHRCPTHLEQGVDGVIADVITCVQGCLSEASHPVRCLGFGMAGQIERDSGVVLFAPNLGWRSFPLKARLESSLGLAVLVTNDVRAATYGEWCFGAGRGVADLVCIFVGTGIGGGIVSQGQLQEGCRNIAGEIGHMTIVVNGRRCHCRNYGCLEAYASGWAIAQRAREAADADSQAGQRLIALAGGTEQISAATVSQAYANGDPLAEHLVKETAQYLAAGIVGVVNILNPCLVILGGGVIQGLPDYITMAGNIVRTSALGAAVAGLHIAGAALGSKAGVIGAATLARHNFALINK